MTSPAQQMQFSAAPPERLLRSAIRRMRPYIASDPGFMEQNARGIVADLRQTFPDLAPPEAPLGDAARIFSKAGLLKLGTFVGPEKIADIRAHFADKTVVYENENRDYVGEGPVDAAPANTFVANHGIRDILTCPHLVDIANDPAILSIVRGSRLRADHRHLFRLAFLCRPRHSGQPADPASRQGLLPLLQAVRLSQ